MVLWLVLYGIAWRKQIAWARVMLFLFYMGEQKKQREKKDDLIDEKQKGRRERIRKKFWKKSEETKGF